MSVWYRLVKKKRYMLTNGKEVVHRVVKVRLFIWLSSLAPVWPPPLTCDRRWLLLLVVL